MFTEYKRTVNGEKKWVNGDYFKKNHFFGVYEGEKEYEVIELHESRDYGLFATLAGVRNYSNKTPPISEPKGLPEDACDISKKESEDYGCDGHSHSWLTLKEIKDYRYKNDKIIRSGLLSNQQRIDLDNGIEPEHWYQGTNQEDFERRDWEVENDSLPPLIKKMEERAKILFQSEWQEYNDSNDDNIRIVFWFDN